MIGRPLRGVWIALLALGLGLFPIPAVAQVILRVAIANGSRQLRLSSSTTATVMDAQGRPAGQLAPMRAQMAQFSQGYVSLGSVRSGYLWVRPAAEGLVYVGDRWYRGQVLLYPRSQGLLAINYVELDTYLYSVVGAEMYPSWPAAALMAQAVAARSYAFFKRLRPVDRLYDIGATERHQVYKGLHSEHPTTLQAVHATRGQVLTHKGGVVMTQYAATDDIVTDVFKGRGMSQHGANRLAQQSYSYLQILNHFYPGTRLGKIEGY